MSKPTIIVLCGSTRFYEHFMRANYEETMAGRIVLSVGFYPHAQEEMHHEQVGCTSDQKRALDELHLRKIDLADEVLVLNPRVIVCGRCGKPARLFTEASGETECCRESRWERRPYVGDSTRREVAYARSLGKPIRWLEPEQEGTQ